MDVWNLPGGGMEPGETPQDTLKREVKEETGLQISVGQLVALNPKPQINELVLTFECSIVGGKITTTNEANKHEWFHSNNLPFNTVPKQLERIRHFFKKPGVVFLDVQNYPNTKSLLVDGKLEEFNKKLLK
jgi:ADP-ribose pyrophosphatase YjhB (NUDIX family)